MQFFLDSIIDTHFPLFSSGYKEQTNDLLRNSSAYPEWPKKTWNFPLKKIAGLIINYDWSER